MYKLERDLNTITPETKYVDFYPQINAYLIGSKSLIANPPTPLCFRQNWHLSGINQGSDFTTRIGNQVRVKRIHGGFILSGSTSSDLDMSSTCRFVIFKVSQPDPTGCRYYDVFDSDTATVALSQQQNIMPIFSKRKDYEFLLDEKITVNRISGNNAGPSYTAPYAVNFDFDIPCDITVQYSGTTNDWEFCKKNALVFQYWGNTSPVTMEGGIRVEYEDM